MNIDKKAKSILKRVLQEPNLQRLSIIRRFFRDVLATFRPEGQLVGYPVPVYEIESRLINAGFRSEDTILVQSSLSSLWNGWSSDIGIFKKGPVAYASSIIKMLMNLVGQEGTILMATSPFGRPYANYLNGIVFDYRSSPTRFGLLPEIFRRRSDVVRSVNPEYNLSGWGKKAEEMIFALDRSFPYVMGKESPWYRMNELGGKVILLGTTFAANSLLVVVDNVHADEYPRPLFLDKPVEMAYVDRDGSVKKMPIRIHSVPRSDGDVDRFCFYLQHKYNLYRIDALGTSQIITYEARKQYELLKCEMENNICWVDAFSWKDKIGNNCADNA